MSRVPKTIYETQYLKTNDFRSQNSARKEKSTNVWSTTEFQCMIEKIPFVGRVQISNKLHVGDLDAEVDIL